MPKATKKKVPSRLVQTRVDPHVAEQLAQRATRAYRSVADYVRILILADLGLTDPPPPITKTT